MTDKFVGIDVKGLDELNRKIERFPVAVQDAIVEKVADYLVKVLQTEQPTPNHNITRRQAYPETGDGFFTARQRKWFFWALNTGRLQLPYRRTQTTRRGWRIIGKGKQAMVVNEEEGAFWTRDNERQARLNALVGWKKIADVLREKHDEITRQAVAGANAGIKKAGLS